MSDLPLDRLVSQLVSAVRNKDNHNYLRPFLETSLSLIDKNEQFGLHDKEGNCLHLHYDSMIGHCHDCGKNVPVGEVATVKEARKLAVSQPRRLIVSAAIRTSVGEVVTGHRHHDCIRELASRPGAKLPVTKDAEQGFVDNYGDFWNRLQALEIFKKARQVPHAGKLNKLVGLFSEDLY